MPYHIILNLNIFVLCLYSIILSNIILFVYSFTLKNFSTIFLFFFLIILNIQNVIFNFLNCEIIIKNTNITHNNTFHLLLNFISLFLFLKIHTIFTKIRLNLLTIPITTTIIITQIYHYFLFINQLFIILFLYIIL